MEDAASEVMTLTQVEAGEVRVPEQDRPEKVISQELEAREVEDAETDSSSGQNMKSCLVCTFVVSEVQRAAQGYEDRDQLVKAGARGPQVEEVIRTQPGEDQRVEDVVSRESLQHCHPQTCHIISFTSISL